MQSAKIKDDLIRTVREWGYFDSIFVRQKPFLQGTRMLEIGMGGGPFSVAAIEVAKCASYVGVDPKVGTDSVLYLKYKEGTSLSRYRAFPFSPDQIMEAYPNIRLYGDILENVKSEVRAFGANMAYMASVTEHLRNLPEVFETIWSALEEGGRLWFNHHGYHSWTGHHLPPRDVASWDPGDLDQARVVDWKHLDPAHPSYNDANFNRVRLADLRKLVNKFFHILQWKYTFHAADRLTTEIRLKHQKYSLEELLGRTVEVFAVRRDRPLDEDFSSIPFYHPPESYFADADYSNQVLKAGNLSAEVYFGPPDNLVSHSTNNFAAREILKRLSVGDRIRLRKHFEIVELTVAEVKNSKGDVTIKFKEQPPEAMQSSGTDWAIDAIQSWQSFGKE